MDFFVNRYPITDEEFNRFHSSDRRVYRRLVFNLRRDPAESSRVMALWLWLEHAVRALLGRGLIPWIIISLIDPDLSALADESVVVLRCVEMDASLPPPPPLELPMFRRFVWNGDPINLRFFYDNRLAVVRGVAEKSNSVCLRAFRDIMQRAVEWRADEIASQMMLASAAAAAAAPPPPPTPVLVVNNLTPVATPVMAYYYPGYGASSSNSPLNNINNNGIVTNTGFRDSSASSYYYYNINANNTNTNNAMTTRVDNNINNNNNNNNQYFYNIGQTNERRGDVIRAVAAPAIPAAVVPVGGSGGGARAEEEVDEMSEILRGLEIGLGGDDDQEEIVGINNNNNNNNNNNTNVFAGPNNDYESYGFGFVDFDEEVAEDERTIFLTFSKGYPITETEVRDYFTSKYGNRMIEAIHMQEVRSREEQPLYARLVVRSLALMEIFLGSQSRLKFSIAGKHVWARKYIRKSMSKFDDASPSA